MMRAISASEMLKGDLFRLVYYCIHVTAHFVTHDFAKRLKFPMKKCSIPIAAIDELNTTSKNLVRFSFFSLHSGYQKTLSFLTADIVPDEIFPRCSIDLPKNLRLADPQFHLPRSVDILIGSGATLSLLSVGQINLSSNGCDLILQKTLLGWAIAGGTTSERDRAVFCNLAELTHLMTNLWHIEDNDASSTKSIEEQLCETHYVANTKRDCSGRNIVRLPFRNHELDLGISWVNPTLKTKYDRVMREYLDLGHMTPITDESVSGYYLPQLAVIKHFSSTTKFRVVFDASAKSDKGISLNDNLLVGPTIQDTLFTHLLRFRVYVYVLTADIEKMYRQVWVHPLDRRFQRIF